jgi:two-component system nitrogen regulation sensor histidine kinase GlnL
VARASGGLIRLGRRAATRGTPSPLDALLALPVPALMIDPDGLVTDANPAAELLFNQSQQTMAGRDWIGLAGLDQTPGEAPFSAYDMAVAPGGKPMRADLMVAPIVDHPGWRLVTIQRRQHAHFADRHSSKLTASSAAATLAHEIKNPLSGIRGAAQLLQAGAEGRADLTRLIKDEVDRIAALIDRMEGFTDTRPLDLGPQNIHAILTHAREVARSGFARGMAIRESYDPSLPAVLGHRDSMVQIFLNLMKNAAEAGSPTITLTTAYRHGISISSAQGRRTLPIEICVIDEGPGAPERIAANLFDPFVTSKPSGGGLGLALVDKLVTDHGGVVEYAREGTPPRTVFRILFQRA